MIEILLFAFVFAAVTVGAFGIVSLIGGGGQRRLRGRLDALTDEVGEEESVQAIRARYLRQLSPLERRLEQLPVVESLSRLVEQAGWSVPAYRVAAFTLALAVAAALAMSLASLHPALLLLAALCGAALPWLKALHDRTQRLEKFEAQLPDALDLMSRSLLAGNPLMESFKFVSEEMKPPIATDFGRAWSNVNYGISLKTSLADLLQRTPSLSLRSLATAILVQRETGGNLAEILQKITQVLRARARFERRLRTLTAEGRLSGWVLGGLPFALAGLLSITSPGYLPVLFNTATGQKLMAMSGVLMVIGFIWMSRVSKVRV